VESLEKPNLLSRMINYVLNKMMKKVQRNSNFDGRLALFLCPIFHFLVCFHAYCDQINLVTLTLKNKNLSIIMQHSCTCETKMLHAPSFFYLFKIISK